MKAESRRILVVDDEPDIVAAIGDVLKGAGYTVETSVDGEQALKRLTNHERPDLMILDLKMPNRSGQEVLSALTKTTTLIDLPVVILSAYLEVPPAGAVAWLKKPVAATLLLETVGHYVNH